ncbi:MAG: protein kinase, partial [Actinomycetes bacterium]
MSAADHPIGTTLLGRYAIRSHLGAGTSANVYLAQDLTLQRQVAVKLLLPGLANDEAFLKRFRAEAQVVAALNHPNVMRVFDWGEDVDGPFLVLEYLSGGSLKELEDRGIRLSPAQAATFGVQAAAGLAYAHERGLVHRDVKPANFMFDDEGRVRVTDFGVARALAEASWTEPVGSMIGTVRYASPEQASGATIDGRADVYALALVLFEAVTGSVPFAGDTQIAALMARVGAELPQLESLDALGPVIHAASAPEPELRIDARRMVGQLEVAVKQLPEPDPLPLHGLRPKSSSSIGFRPPSTDELTQSVPAATRRPQRSRSAGLYDQQADSRFDETVIGASGAVAIATPRRIARRRWILLAFMAALVTAGGIVLAIQEKVFTPSHPVPSLTMQTANEAQRTLAALHLTLTFGQSRYSLKIPVDHIVVQLPRAGASLKEGDSVRV